MCHCRRGAGRCRLAPSSAAHCRSFLACTECVAEHLRCRVLQNGEELLAPTHQLGWEAAFRRAARWHVARRGCVCLRVRQTTAEWHCGSLRDTGSRPEPHAIPAAAIPRFAAVQSGRLRSAALFAALVARLHVVDHSPVLPLSVFDIASQAIRIALQSILPSEPAPHSAAQYRPFAPFLPGRSIPISINLPPFSFSGPLYVRNPRLRRSQPFVARSISPQPLSTWLASPPRLSLLLTPPFAH